MTTASYSKPQAWNISSAFNNSLLDNGLIALVPAFDGGGDPWDYLRNEPVIKTGANASWTIGRRGKMLTTVSGGTGSGFNYGDSSNWLPTESVTVLVHKRKTDVTNRQSSAFGINAAADNGKRLGAHVPWSDGTVYWDFGGVTGGTDRLSVASLSFGDDFWVFNAGYRGMEIWRNGALEASQAGHATRTSATEDFMILNGNANVAIGQDECESALFAMWDRQLSQNDCASLSLNPWGLIQYNPSSRVLVEAAAATSPSWTGSNTGGWW